MDEHEGLITAAGQAAHYVSSAIRRFVPSNSGGGDVSWDESDQYDMNHPRRGVAVIVNNEKFSVPQLGKRPGTQLDAENLELVLGKLGFTVKIQTNLRVSEMRAFFLNMAKVYPQDVDCFLCVILSHGGETTVPEGRPNVAVREDVVYGTDGPLPTREILELFNDTGCPALCGKPRIFFIQACRGVGLDSGQEVLLTKVREEENMDVTDAIGEPALTISPPPLYKDFLLMYSSPPGYYSFRRPDLGSWFISSLCEVMKKYDLATTDLLKLLTKVTRKVGHDLESHCNIKSFHGKKQSPCLYSMLTKDVFFPPKK